MSMLQDFEIKHFDKLAENVAYVLWLRLVSTPIGYNAESYDVLIFSGNEAIKAVATDLDNVQPQIFNRFNRLNMYTFYDPNAPTDKVFAMVRTMYVRKIDDLTGEPATDMSGDPIIVPRHVAYFVDRQQPYSIPEQILRGDHPTVYNFQRAMPLFVNEMPFLSLVINIIDDGKKGE